MHTSLTVTAFTRLRPSAPATARPLLSNTNPRNVDVQLPAGRIVQLTVDGADQGDVPHDEIERLFTLADWKAAEVEHYRSLVAEYGEAEAREQFVTEYGAYPIPDAVPYDSGSRPFFVSTYEQWVSPPARPQHPKGRAVNEVALDDVLDDSVRAPKHYTAVSVFALTDYPAAFAAGADDFLTWGLWGYFTITPTDLDVSYGAFADGEETAASEIPLAGTASYAGLTQAQAIRGGRPSRGNLDDDAYWDDRVAFLRGDVNLQASFASGTVTGNVRALQGADEPAADFPSNVTIDLGTAPIEAGTFEGDARATSGLPGAVGKWGGQFFGTPAAGEAPPAAGGTWGVTQGTGDNDWKMVGGFGSWRETDGGSMTPDDGSTAMPTPSAPSACEVGGTVSPGGSLQPCKLRESFHLYRQCRRDRVRGRLLFWSLHHKKQLRRHEER